MAFLQQKVVGFLGVERLSGEEAVLKHIAVLRHYRRLGIGKQMLDNYMRLYRIPTIEAETDRDAVQFYRHIGFQIKSLGEKYPGVERFRCIYYDGRDTR
ncbi:GNAT family N-acetyltransferase [Paenibacillus sp. 1P07SE]|uniref:GNAT family N-acetyltransferase n=1 Tax=Paenibacillus sp. 1P07SE TaxID=3132209 RepID=UPI0039A73F3B